MEVNDGLEDGVEDGVEDVSEGVPEDEDQAARFLPLHPHGISRKLNDATLCVAKSLRDDNPLHSLAENYGSKVLDGYDLLVPPGAETSLMERAKHAIATLDLWSQEGVIGRNWYAHLSFYFTM